VFSFYEHGLTGFRVQVSGFRVQGSGFRVQGSPPKAGPPSAENLKLAT